MGGSDAPDDTIPWQVLLIIDGRRVGGMVIADRWIMTTAHNVVHDGNNISSEAIKVSVVLYVGLIWMSVASMILN